MQTVADHDPAAVERVGAELARVQARQALDVADADSARRGAGRALGGDRRRPSDIGMRIAAPRWRSGALPTHRYRQHAPGTVSRLGERTAR